MTKSQVLKEILKGECVMTFEYNIPATTLWGGGTRKLAGKTAHRLGIRKAMIVCDQYLKALPVIEEITSTLLSENIDYEIFSDISSEPSNIVVEEAVKLLINTGCNGLISIGGGSSIDAAKAVSVLASNGGSISDFQGYNKVGKRGLCHIAIPTTAGTGSEVTRVTVINDLNRNVKMMCLDNAFMPDASIIDYELTLSMPRSLTAFVGLDALTHAIEAYVSLKANSISDMFALNAISLISNNIVEAFNNPDSHNARENMMQGASMAGIAFSNSSVCAIHGMSRPIGAYFHVPHGLSNAFLLPLVTERSLDGNIPRYAEIADKVECTNRSMSNKEKAMSLASHLNQLNKILEIPNMKNWGIDHAKYEEVVSEMALAALDSGSPANNPKLFSRNDIINMYLEVYNY